jgi:heme oxygenase
LVTTQHGLGAPPAGARLPALETLRRRTRQAHQDLDSAFTSSSGHVADAAGYLRLVTTLSSLHSRTDAPLRAWVRSTPWVRRALDPATLPRRSPLYASDLAALGHPQRAVPTLGGVCDDAQGLGYLYVVAGSSKGARVVLHHLPDHVAPDARRGLLDAAEAGSRLWRDCRPVLTAPLPEDLVERAAEEAHRLFQVLLRGLQRDREREERAG